MKHEILQKDKFKYVSLILLKEIINFQHYFPVKCQGEDVFLEPYLVSMEKSGFLTIKKGQYIPTDKGREELVSLFAKYHEYLKMFDIYCAVDLEKGVFAFSSINSDMDDAAWRAFLQESRFSDVRVAVAEFKGLNPTEIVFLTFFNDGVFDCEADHWQNKLTSDEIWREIEEICNTAVSAEYLKADDVLENVIKQGTVIAMDLIKQAEDAIAFENQQQEDEAEETVTETTTTTETTEEYVDVVYEPYYDYGYWDPYYDPFYISPLWLVPAIILF